MDPHMKKMLHQSGFSRKREPIGYIYRERDLFQGIGSQNSGKSEMYRAGQQYGNSDVAVLGLEAV